MLITNANLAVLNNTFNGIFNAAFEKAPAWSDQIATRVTVNGVKGIYGFAAVNRGVREWIGERMSIAAMAHSYELPHRKFEYTFQVPRDHILRDQLGIYTSMVIPQMAENVKAHPDQVIAKTVLQDNPNGFDGVPFFGNNHPTYNGSSTYTNDFDVDASSLEKLGDELARVRAEMSGIVGQDGIVLRTNMGVILTPVRHEIRFKKVCNSTTVPADGTGSNIDNPLVGIFKVIPIPQLDGIDPDVAYMLDVSRAIKPIIWQVGSNPVFRSFTTAADNLHAFLRDEFIYGVDGDNGGAYEVNAGVTLPFLAARLNLTNLPT